MNNIRQFYRRTRDTARHYLWTFWERQPDSRKHAVRNLLFMNVGSLFVGTPPYEQWQNAKAYFDCLLTSQVDVIHLKTLSLSKKTEAKEHKRIAVHAHIFYAELAPELLNYFNQFPASFDLYISTPHEHDSELLSALFSQCSQIEKLVIQVTPNQGRDLGPMFAAFGKQLLNYDYFCHIHTKKSIGTNTIGQRWREYLWSALLSNQDQRLEKIWSLLQTHALVYPQKFHWIDVTNCQWGANHTQAIELCQDLGIAPPPDGYIEFPVGSMFWAQTQALAPLLQMGLAFDDFDPELGQTDQTLAHALERFIGYLTLAQGHKIALIQNPLLLNHYP